MSNLIYMEKTKPIPQTIEELEKRCLSLEDENAALAAKLKWYEEQYRLSIANQYGSSSEKTDQDQMELPLFNEAEVTADPTVEEPTTETITYKRKKVQGQREALLESLPTETVEYRLTDEACSSCGHDLHEMSTEERREIEVIPAQVKVKKHVRHVYSCRQCERHGIETPIQTAPMPNPVFPKSLASPSSLAYILNQKYVEGLPLYRQEKQLNRMGIPLKRQTISNWILEGAKPWLEPMFDRLHQHLIQQDALHADETTLQVLQEPGKSASSNSYMWMYRSGRESVPIVLYDYKRTRAGKHPVKFLQDFTGYLHVDGYQGYNKIPRVTLVGCWAHARRKFDEALKALPDSMSSSNTLAKQGLDYCNQLFQIEKKTNEFSSKERLDYRHKHSQPVLEAFSEWLKIQKPKVPPKSALGEAIKYCLNQWGRLEAFMKDGQLEIDNNRGERSIKPFVIGRKNWLFANSLKGAEASALIYSIVETAKENNLNPLYYLTYLFETLPNIDLDDPEKLDQLLPWSESLPEECHIPNQTK